ncbi:MAG: helix-turn-helix domain-containing protein [Candidatus Lokiarchaeota archaeon]|nr:helix-turn-helix domain-containing protein [Candidatus Lokiarchaeota archaeon]MBD3340796.1 helix-turn-helix domain-containing protein [Candidatus Lokiarchaeota archaeon]
MHLTHKVRIYPTKTQENALWILSEKCRLLYNFALRDRIHDWKKNKQKPKKNGNISFIPTSKTSCLH